MDLKKTLSILDATQSMVQAQQQANAAASAPPQQSNAPQAPSDPAANKALGQLSALLDQANTQPAQPNEVMADLQKQAALMSAKVNALVAAADALEASINLAPQPEQIDASELFAQFKEIMDQLNKDLAKLNKEIEEKKQANAMKSEQKPTTMKPGEQVGDLSFNQTLSLQ